MCPLFVYFYKMEGIISLKKSPLKEILGLANKNLQTLKEVFNGKIYIRGEELFFQGDEKEFEILKKTFEILKKEAREGNFMEKEEIISAVDRAKRGETDKQEKEYIITPKKIIYPKSKNQARYVEALRTKDIVFAIGPAGTGKTFLAVAVAIEFLRSRKVERIVLTRPAIEAGESLGYLPGDYKEKVAPYLTPLYDALFQMFPFDKIRKYTDAGIIEIAPIAYMRGRTLSNAFIILDEAQNTTSLQMKMFLTRIGTFTKVAVTGDITQIDLPRSIPSGMKIAMDILKNIEGIDFCTFDKNDVVRHPIVKKIIEAYEKYEDKERTK